MLREQKMLERLQRRERALTVVKNGSTSMSRRQQEREEIRSFLPDPENGIKVISLYAFLKIRFSSWVLLKIFLHL